MTEHPRSKTLTGISAFLGALFALIIWERVTSHWIACKHPWVFFDLGDTLIDVKFRKGKDVEYLPGASEYLRTLKSKGYHIGLITNVPENWGDTHRTKVRVLKKEVGQMWNHALGAQPMSWEDFGDTRILVPPLNENRKPAPYLFKSAINEVVLEEGDTKCPVVYQGEDPKEIAVAKSLGMVAHLVTYKKNSPSDPDPGIPQFLDLSELPVVR